MGVALLAWGRFFGPHGERVTVPAPRRKAEQGRAVMAMACSIPATSAARMSYQRCRPSRVTIDNPDTDTSPGQQARRSFERIPMSSQLLWTSADSLIVAFALAFAMPRWHALPLALMFGLCDGLGSVLGLSLPLAGGLGAILLMACGAAQRLLKAPGWLYVLPPLLAIDNVMSRTSDAPALAALSSAIMAGLGFACGAIALSWWREDLRDARPLAAACLIAAGSLLAWGA